ncbi:hypothetical protein [Brassicibacter mesophilus]|uniref:hypothetical protein n=1 Tax=Brassicibacter mesophilus TaxID=745119 RepID=UPI003D1F8CE1
MRGKFVSGIIAGSLVGATASMYAMNRMSPRQRKRMMKISRRMMSNMISNIGLF